MINASRLLADCQRLVRHLEDKDLRERLAENPDLEARVKAEFERALDKRRTGQSYAVWRDEHLTQVAVHWVLAAVFVRFLEDNALLPDPWISGPGSRRDQAQERHDRFFAREPAASDREYLLACFREVEALPAMAPLFDERHNPLFQLGPTADGAKAIVALFRKVDSATGELVHDFTDKEWNTRFLGDLYQDLSEAAQERYALFQTPEFVEEFLLDRTLEPAMEDLGYQKVTLIDPACGSGHFLLGTFHRIFARWRANDAVTNDTALARNAMDQISGVDLNPFAVAIARFRLLIAALKVSGIHRLADAPAFPLHVAAGDSLLHGGARSGHIAGRTRDLFGADEYAHYYATEDADELRWLLGRQYTVVVGNPPYITPRDPALNQLYRDRFGACHRQYSLAMPFTELIFDLAARAGIEQGSVAGWIGMITTNSFMKREFGKKLIERYIPRWDLTHIIDTSGAHLVGHDTPTVILIGRNQPPIGGTIRAVLGIRGEPSTPEDPSKGLVWSAIMEQLDLPGSQSAFVSVVDLPRERFHKHPWSIGGGGVSDLKDLIENRTSTRLSDLVEAVGRTTVVGEDDAWVLDKPAAKRQGVLGQTVGFVVGESVRDWSISNFPLTVYPYETLGGEPIPSDSYAVSRFLWPARTTLRNRTVFGKSLADMGRSWYEHLEHYRGKLRTPLSIAFAFVATHNHFALDRGGKVFNRTAPAIKLSAASTEADHFPLLGILNSSAACLWMKQVFYPKATATGDISVEKGKPEANRYEFTSTRLLEFPVPDHSALTTVCEIARELDQLAQRLGSLQPHELVARWEQQGRVGDLKVILLDGERQFSLTRRRMVYLQEELDWEVYRAYGLVQEGCEILSDLGIDPTERPAFWNSHPPEELDARLRQRFERRRQLIEDDPDLKLIETAMYKRPWLGQQGVFGHATATYSERAQQALANRLLDRLEDRRYWPEPQVTSTARLADHLRQDDEFRQIAALYRGRDDFDWTDLITELVSDESVPFLSSYRYTDSGQRKREEWEETWRLQRREDAGEKLDPIAVPPRYDSKDFRKPPYWRLRGKLDVPKERFILYPGLERAADRTPVIGWAGWDHLQQAQALATAYQDLREQEGWEADRLAPILAGLQELIPWLRQWHNEPDPAHHGERLGDFFAAYLEEEARALGLTPEALKAWRPEEKKSGRKPGRKKKSEEPGLFED